MRAFQFELENNLKKLQSLAQYYQTHLDQWVIESEHHVHIGKGGLNGTDYAVKSPLACCEATRFKTAQEAENNIDHYIVDGLNKPIEFHIELCSDFFAREAENTKKLLVFINERKNSK